VTRHAGPSGQSPDDRDLGDRGSGPESGQAPAEGSRATGGAATDAGRREHRVLEPQRGDNRQHEGEHPTLAAHIFQICGAARARLQVMPQTPTAQPPATGRSQLGADLLTRSVARVPALAEPGPGAEYQALHVPDPGSEHLGHLGL
jgi:hypothetical protein